MSPYLEAVLKRLAPIFNIPKKRILLVILPLILILVFALVIYHLAFAAPQSSASLEVYAVREGTSTQQIAGELEDRGFVKSSLGFRAVFSLRGGGTIEVGAYRISKAMSAWQIAGILQNEPELRWVVIPEGLRKEEIAVILGDTLKWSADDEQKWIKTYTAMEYDYIEGVYFPDTYLIPINEAPLDVAKRLRAHFQEKFAPYAKEAANQNIKWDTALKLASIVQREAAGTDDMPLIAGVLWNRLLKGQKLEVDATVQYARGDVGKGWWAPIKPEDKQIDSSYNTYAHKGLPPHPISNPGLEAIAAVLNPTETKCLFYLHDSTGTIHCAETYEEHLENIEKYLK